MIALVIVAMAVGTLLLRLSLLAPAGQARLPEGLQRALRFVAPAVLAGLVVPAVVAPEGTIAVGAPRALAALVALVVAVITRSVVGTLVVGMGALWLLELPLQGQ